MPRGLKEKVTIVTGAGTGIGEAIAHRLALEGAWVVVNGLPLDPVHEVVESIRGEGGVAIGYEGDVSEEEHAEACVRTALDRWDRLDVLINNAGVFLATGETQDYPVDDFDETIRMNLRSTFLMTKHALPHLQRTGGCIVSAGSESGLLGLAENTPYGGTKAWIHAFTRGVAVEQARHGVRANAVCPGAIDTAWTHAELGPMTEEMERSMVAATPLGRRGTVEEVANVYAFLASEEASYVTGALWTVDGGVTAAKGNVGDKVPEELRRRRAEPMLHHLRHSKEGLEHKETRRAGGGEG